MWLYENSGVGGDEKLIIKLIWPNIRKREVIVLLSLNPHTSFHLLSIHIAVIHSNKTKFTWMCYIL